MKNVLWVSILTMVFAFTPVEVSFAGKGAGGSPVSGSQGTTRMENEEQHQQALEKGSMGQVDPEKVRTHNYQQERKRLEDQYRERANKLEEDHKKEQKQLRTRYEEQKRILEQQRHQEMLQLEEQYQKSGR